MMIRFILLDNFLIDSGRVGLGNGRWFGRLTFNTTTNVANRNHYGIRSSFELHPQSIDTYEFGMEFKL